MRGSSGVRNRYFGRCCRCDAAVPAGAGTLTADGDVLCAAHTPESARREPRPEMADELAQRAAKRRTPPGGT